MVQPRRKDDKVLTVPYPIILQPSLPPNTIVPEDEFLFISYLNRLYEDIANTVNNKVNTFFRFAVTDTATDMPNIPNFGAYVVCVSGTEPERDNLGNVIGGLPTINASLCKADPGAAGSVAVLGSQVGTGTWAGFALTITSTATNFQIAHNRAGVTGNFNLIILGTQGAP